LGNSKTNNILIAHLVYYCRDKRLSLFSPINVELHTWYLAIDMQLYILGPFLLLIVYKWGKKGAAVVLLITLGFVAYLFSVMVINDYSL